MAKYTRRNFLKKTAAGLGALTLAEFLASCGQAISSTLPPAEAPTNTPPVEATNAPPQPASSDTTVPPSPTDTALPPTATETAVPPTATPRVVPDLVVARGGEPEALVRSAMAALGGMQMFVSKGANVIIKPNICCGNTYEYAATTNPWVVGTLVKMCFEAGAGKVRVMDYPFQCSEVEGYKTSGIRQQVEAAGGEMAYMTPLYKYVMTPIPNGLALKQTEVFDDILKADVLINVPIAKDHGSTRLTLGMKNLMGVVLHRNTLHVIGLGQCIADLTSLIRPKLTVVDAVRILTAHGPTGGYLSDVKKLDTVIASRDVVAADSFATTLFGLQPSDIAYIVAGAAMGLGRSDLQNLKIEEIPVGT